MLQKAVWRQNGGRGVGVGVSQWKTEGAHHVIYPEVHLSDAESQSLDMLCASNGKSRSALVREALRAYRLREAPRQSQAQLAPLSRASGWLADGSPRPARRVMMVFPDTSVWMSATSSHPMTMIAV